MVLMIRRNSKTFANGNDKQTRRSSNTRMGSWLFKSRRGFCESEIAVPVDSPIKPETADTSRTVGLYADDATASSSERPRPTVRFNDEVQEYECELTLTDEIKSDLWVTKSETKTTLEKAKDVAKFQMENRKIYMHTFDDAIRRCFRAKDEVSGINGIEDPEFLSRSNARGSEGRMFLKLSQHKKTHIKMVVKTYNKLTKNKNHEYSSVAQKVGEKAVKSSRPHRILAHALGKGDAIVAGRARTTH